MQAVYRENGTKGLVVQLVRIHACHAWGRGFEPRPDRKALDNLSKAFLFNNRINPKVVRLFYSKPGI